MPTRRFDYLLISLYGAFLLSLESRLSYVQYKYCLELRQYYYLAKLGKACSRQPLQEEYSIRV